MEVFYVNIDMPPYLAQWFIHEFGGDNPVVLPKLSVEKRILELYLIKRPKFVFEPDLDGSVVSVVIPNFKFKPPHLFNYLPKAARKEFADCIRDRFIVQLWRDIHRPANFGKRKDKLFEAWMIAHGIEFNDTNSNAVTKVYQRQCNTYRVRRFRAKRAKAKSC